MSKGARVAGRSSKPRQPLRKRRKRTSETHTRAVGRRWRGQERVRWHWRYHYHERNLFSFIFQPPSFSSRHSKEEDRGIGSSCALVPQRAKVKGRALLEETGEKKRGMDEDRGYSVFRVLSHEPERGRPRGHGPLYTKIHRPMKDLCANMSCAPHGCYLPLCLPPNLIVVCFPVLISIFLLFRARETYHTDP